MVTVLKEKDLELVDKLFSSNSVEKTEYSLAVTARFSDEILGYCLFDLEPERIVIHKVEPIEDIMLADGILRSALHIAAERSIMNAFYSKAADEELFLKLGFIKEKAERRLDIDKLFGGCGCKRENG
ncbi:MAG: hypothetical protein PUF48_06800 [Oscillospiraceae bacterium]|nr:hypothetical protein [Oscillospiraceae bacterium]